MLFGYADGFAGGSNLASGVIMAVFSAIGSAVYKVGLQICKRGFKKM